MTDPIADMLTRIRNGVSGRKERVEIPASKFKIKLAEILHEEGFVGPVEIVPAIGEGTIVVTLRTDRLNRSPISGIRRVSRPGQRIYSSADELPKIRGGLGTSILSTPKGMMTDRDARKARVGGEVICQIW